ncbi:MAG: S8 family serine peptidase, partial [Pseudonocardiaceae bacterium]
MSRLSRRLGAVALAAALSALAPGVNPLTMGTPTAWAQERATWMPPPPSAAGRPDDGGGNPDQEYVRQAECVRSNQTRNKELILKNQPWGQMHLRLDEVHRYMESQYGSIGAGIKVAVIDTGVTPHPFLDGRLEGGGDYVGGGDGLEDCDGHGTQVAGIIAANVTDPSAAFRGVAPDSRIVSIRQSSQVFRPKSDQEKASEERQAESDKALEEAQREAREAKERAEQAERQSEQQERSDEAGGGETGAGSPDGATRPGQDKGPRVQESSEAAGNLHTLAQAVVRAADTPGVKVINMSIDSCRPGGTAMTSKERELQSAVHYAFGKDIVVVAAAGNTSDACQQNSQADPNNPTTIVTPPWFSEDLLAVAAIDERGGVAPFSMHGPWVSVAAPGTKIISLDPAKGSNQLANLTFEGGEPTELRGTSFAAPYVAGLAVLVRQAHPDLDARQVMDRIMATAQHPGTRSGRDQFVGFGVINPMAALTATVASETGVEPAADIRLPSDMPPPNPPDETPMIVALAGAGGAAAALGLTLFVLHSIRRNR